jgi:hypothetical protein
MIETHNNVHIFIYVDASVLLGLTLGFSAPIHACTQKARMFNTIRIINIHKSMKGHISYDIYI